jgi:serine protease inhibitor
MLREGGQSYYEDDKVQAVPLGFKKNGSMYIILPKTGDATEFLASMTNEYFNEMNFGRAEGKLLLPRFFMENDIKGLKEALIAMGVPLFDPDTDPLTKVIEEFPVYLSDAIQKASITVDEKGTTAAAVTVLPGKATSPGPPEEPPRPFEMICDKPFVFVLC